VHRTSLFHRNTAAHGQAEDAEPFGNRSRARDHQPKKWKPKRAADIGLFSNVSPEKEDHESDRDERCYDWREVHGEVRSRRSEVRDQKDRRQKTEDRGRLQLPQQPSRISDVNTGNVDVLGHHCAGTDYNLITNRDWKNGRISPDAD